MRDETILVDKLDKLKRCLNCLKDLSRPNPNFLQDQSQGWMVYEWQVRECGVPMDLIYERIKELVEHQRNVLKREIAVFLYQQQT